MNRPSRSAAGFTLVEVLVTLAIMSLVMLGLHVTLHSTIYAHDDVAIDIARVREGPRILDMIERDLRALHVYNIKDRKVLRGQLNRAFAKRADRIDFLTGTDSSARIRDPQSDDEQRWLATDITEIGYRLRPRPDHEDFLELYRREDPFVDDDPLEGGRYELIHDRITWFEISYRKQLGPEGELEEEWDMAESQKLPAAIIVKLELQVDPKLVGDYADIQTLSNMPQTYTRVIPLPRTLNSALNVRPAKLTEIDENQAGAGGGGGGGGPGGPGGGGDGGGGDMGFGGEGGPNELIDMDEEGGRGRMEFRQSLNDVFTITGSGGPGGPPPDLSDDERQLLEDLLEQYGDDFDF